MIHLLYIAIIAFLLTDNKETNFITSAATCACKVTLDAPNRLTAEGETESVSDNVEAISKCEFVKFTDSENPEKYCDEDYVYLQYMLFISKADNETLDSYITELKETRDKLYACQNGDSNDKMEEKGEVTDE